MLDAALALVDEHGHEKLTMRTLATTLGVDPMAPYHYVPNKAALFDGLVERAWSTVAIDGIDVDGDATEQLVEAFCSVYTQLVAHPNLLPLVATRSVATPQALALAERGLELLSRTSSLSPADALQLINTLAALTIGRALAEAAPSAGGQSMDDVLAIARAFPQLATATTAPPASGEDPLPRALRGIIAAWGVAPRARP
ncbi:TetR/AcrR family transcriptional regulator [Homoserinibacter sp. YIM 151385]|uniref:TetR/AcrR family transcriptional regulator n=1 Tax=Homoserinibacter sp. YIM 151385 TaxID=2985506 RepID=UPI0022F00921|nr:TetR/AcrR family transcriptional regulator C-terminal domain-containing protein [Homoserinibacter sp. YIM 151385]WBU38794.1 TetR/AcrR family transcriptional regulator C-terminal domain-containing protein [Homoserinibacter sp. YIM 151385]